MSATAGLMVARVIAVAPIMMITSPAATSGVRPGAERPGEDQAERTQELGHPDEPQERARQRHLRRHLFDRHDQLRPTGEQEDQGEQHLNGPQSAGHGGSPSGARIGRSVGAGAW